MDILRRELSPLIDAAWARIDQEAHNVLSTNLSGRRVVDLRGPEGWALSSVNLGRVTAGASREGVEWALRQVQPLIEIRAPFVISLSELDNLARGADPVDVEPVVHAAQKAARFEEETIYNGFAETGITGLREASEHEEISILGAEPTSLLDAVTQALVVFHDAGVAGPHELVLGPKLYRQVLSDNSPYPLRQQLTKLLGCPPIYSPALDGRGLLVSTRGNDFELTIGQDLAIGYERTHGDSVHLFMVESLTFRVLGPEAVIALA